MRTDKYIRLSLFKVGNNLLVGSSGTGSVQIHSGDSRFRKKDFDVIFNLFRTKTAVDQFCSFTGGTGLRQLIGISAIVAGQLVDTFMISQTHIAVLTFRHPAASTAFYHRCKSATVLEKNDLFFLFQCFFHILYQQRRELSDHPPLAMQFFDIHRNNLRQLNFFISFFQLYKSIFSVPCVLPCFYGGGSSAEKRFCSIHGSQYDSRIPCMIAGSRVLLLIGVLMLFVYNHQPQITERKKYGRTDSKDDIISFFSQLLPPYLYPFGIRKLGMINPQTRTEYPLQAFCDLSSQCYFRQEIQYLFPLTNRFFYQMNVYFRLSTGCDSMKQADIFLLKGLHDLIVRPLLKLVQGIQLYDLLHFLVQPADFMEVNLKYLFLHQAIQNRRRHSCTLQQLFFRNFFRCFSSKDSRTLDIFHQQRQLLRSTGQDIK